MVENRNPNIDITHDMTEADNISPNKDYLDMEMEDEMDTSQEENALEMEEASE